MNSKNQNQIQKFLSSLDLREIPSFVYHHLEHTRIEFKRKNKRITFEDDRIEQFASKSAKLVSGGYLHEPVGKAHGAGRSRSTCGTEKISGNAHFAGKVPEDMRASAPVLTSERQKFCRSKSLNSKGAKRQNSALFINCMDSHEID